MVHQAFHDPLGLFLAVVNYIELTTHHSTSSNSHVLILVDFTLAKKIVTSNYCHIPIRFKLTRHY